jgi:hypothetical protein
MAAGVPHAFVTLDVHGVTGRRSARQRALFDAAGRMVGRRDLRLATVTCWQEPRDRLREAGIRCGRHEARDRDPRRAQASRPVLVDSPYDPQNKDSAPEG